MRRRQSALQGQAQQHQRLLEQQYQQQQQQSVVREAPRHDGYPVERREAPATVAARAPATLPIEGGVPGPGRQQAPGAGRRFSTGSEDFRSPQARGRDRQGRFGPGTHPLASGLPGPSTSAPTVPPRTNGAPGERRGGRRAQEGEEEEEERARGDEEDLLGAPLSPFSSAVLESRLEGRPESELDWVKKEVDGKQAIPKREQAPGRGASEPEGTRDRLSTAGSVVVDRPRQQDVGGKAGQDGRGEGRALAAPGGFRERVSQGRRDEDAQGQGRQREGGSLAAALRDSDDPLERLLASNVFLEGARRTLRPGDEG